jgi:hypothetical protein
MIVVDTMLHKCVPGGRNPLTTGASCTVKNRQLHTTTKQTVNLSTFSVQGAIKLQAKTPFFPYLYLVGSVFEQWARTMMNTCWNCERTDFGVNGSAPGSWNTIVTMSLPICRFRNSYNSNNNSS